MGSNPLPPPGSQQGFRVDAQHCDSCGAASQAGQEHCPWCTTPYRTSAIDSLDALASTWDELGDPSFGGGHGIRAEDVSTLLDSRMVTANEIGQMEISSTRRHTVGWAPVPKPEPPLGRIVREAGPSPIREAINWLKGLFK